MVNATISTDSTRQFYTLCWMKYFECTICSTYLFKESPTDQTKCEWNVFYVSKILKWWLNSGRAVWEWQHLLKPMSDGETCWQIAQMGIIKVCVCERESEKTMLKRPTRKWFVCLLPSKISMKYVRYHQTSTHITSSKCKMFFLLFFFFFFY